jgi:glycosyltransferase involved in cell wall biosynthesis
MKIGIDGRALIGSRTGIGRYVYELCLELDRLLPEATFFIYSPTPMEMPVYSKRWILRLDNSPAAKYMKPVLWLKLRCGSLCSRDNLDIFWGSASFLPKLARSVQTVITVYDLNFRIVPETMSVSHRWSFKLFFKADLMKAGVVTAISRGTAQRLFDSFGRRVNAIVEPAVGTAFVPQTSDRVKEILSQYSLHKPYLLGVATWEPRKNLELLIKSFLNMKSQGLLSKHKLVLVGGRGWKDERLASLLLQNDSVIPLGYIPDDHLAPLYSGAEVFIFPSIYEGYGMPVAEALACGTRVVATDTPELREAGRKGTIYIDPTPTGISQGILGALQFSNPVSVHNQEMVTWKESAKILSNIFFDLCNAR